MRGSDPVTLPYSCPLFLHSFMCFVNISQHYVKPNGKPWKNEEEEIQFLLSIASGVVGEQTRRDPGVRPAFRF